jgi:predicted transcriptional regulator
MAKWQTESMKKVTRNVSIPQCIDEMITSDMINQLILENMDRILCGDVEKAKVYRSAVISEQLAKHMRGNKETYVIAREVEDSLKEIFESGKRIDNELDVPYKKLEKIKKDVAKLIQELRTERLEFKRDKEQTLDEMLQSLMKSYEICEEGR